MYQPASRTTEWDLFGTFFQHVWFALGYRLHCGVADLEDSQWLCLIFVDCVLPLCCGSVPWMAVTSHSLTITEENGVMFNMG